MSTSLLLRTSAHQSRRLAIPLISRTYASKAIHVPSDPPPSGKNETQNVPSEPVSDMMTTFTSPINPLLPEDHISPLVIPAGAVSGAPQDLQTRTVRIYKPTKNAMQSSNNRGKLWRLDWDVQGRGYRWENPLMGWQSSADYMQGTHLTFESKEDAVYFAEKQGYDYFVQEPKVREVKSKAYANNFTWSGGKLKKIHAK